MKKMTYVAAFALAMGLAACGGGQKKQAAEPAAAEETPATPVYTVVEKPQVDLSKFKVDKDGYIVLFDGTSLEGWRGYGKDHVPGRWVIEDGCLKFCGTGEGEDHVVMVVTSSLLTSSRTLNCCSTGKYLRAVTLVASTWLRK